MPHSASHGPQRKTSLAVSADHLLGGHPEQTLGSLIYARNMQVFVVKEEGVRELVKNRLQNIGAMPAGIQYGHFVLRIFRL